MSFITSPGVIVPPLTAGGVAYGTGSQAKVTSAGTIGQVLTSAGAGVPTWATSVVPVGGSMIFLSTVTASSSATVDVETTFSSTYRAYLIIGTGVFCDTAATLTCRLKIGGTYITAANYGYHRQNLRANNAAYSASAEDAADEIPLSGTMSTSRSADFVMTVYFPSDTVSEKVIDWKLAPGRLNNDISTGALGYASNATTTALTGVRFYFTVGNVASGQFRLYGIANS